MRHRVKKIKFKMGKDANKMLVKKLIYNFLSSGKITTTIKKAKVLKSVVEKIVEKAKNKKEAGKNYILRYVTDKKLLRKLFETIGPTLKDKIGGYVRIIKLNQRDSDGSEMGRLEWAYPVINEIMPVKKTKKEKSQSPDKIKSDLKKTKPIKK